MILNHPTLTQEELETGTTLYNKRLEYLIQLGEIKLSEIENERKLEDVYFNITELNTRENLFKSKMESKHGQGHIDLINKKYVRSV